MCLSFSDTEELHTLRAGNWHFLGLNFISSHFSLFSAFYLSTNKAPCLTQLIVGPPRKEIYKQMYCYYVSCLLEEAGGWSWKISLFHWPFYRQLGRRIKMQPLRSEFEPCPLIYNLCVTGKLLNFSVPTFTYGQMGITK